ncbi:MAG: hypothetical protein E6Q97_02930 [Desulfurellales bacterium]|nr:MAG: hypothetical protein E6Q97_02930 [Desulfurellales bacterium]
MSENQDQDQKIKTAAGKAPFELLPWAYAEALTRGLGLADVQPEATFSTIEGLAWVFEYGSRKYAPRNYARALPDEATVARYIGAARRHLIADLAGQTFDLESGLPHLDHALASLVMLAVILRTEIYGAQWRPAAWQHNSSADVVGALSHYEGTCREPEAVRTWLPGAIIVVALMRQEALTGYTNKRGNDVPAT